LLARGRDVAKRKGGGGGVKEDQYAGGASKGEKRTRNSVPKGKRELRGGSGSGKSKPLSQILRCENLHWGGGSWGLNLYEKSSRRKRTDATLANVGSWMHVI